MPIYANPPSGGGELHPEGLFAATCVDVIDRGIEQIGDWAARPRVELRWLTSVEDEETGNRMVVMKRYTNSLHEKATLRKDLETWRGKRFTKEELQRFDLETLLQKPCQVQVQHILKDDGGTYANVTAVLPAAKGVPPVKPRMHEVHAPEGHWRASSGRSPASQRSHQRADRRQAQRLRRCRRSDPVLRRRASGAPSPSTSSTRPGRKIHDRAVFIASRTTMASRSSPR